MNINISFEYGSKPINENGKYVLNLRDFLSMRVDAMFAHLGYLVM